MLVCMYVIPFRASVGWIVYVTEDPHIEFGLNLTIFYLKRIFVYSFIIWQITFTLG